MKKYWTFILYLIVINLINFYNQKLFILKKYYLLLKNYVYE